MSKTSSQFDNLITRIYQCQRCVAALPYPPRPVLSVAEESRILIIGQAPGLKAHESQTPWNDVSGDRLRNWMGINKNTFYNKNICSVVPMGFCFPGYNKGSDRPPRKECAPAWHQQLLSHVNPGLTLYVGRYAQQYYLPQFNTLTAAIEHQRTVGHEHAQTEYILPHPSGRNNRWFSRHPWFEAEVIPSLRAAVKRQLPQ
ncbi:uracil-DNA glycosylase family protein [Aestuariibacter sp. A3R04]|uniref:uracil-DNA glycosylase family protein n=1 Tax=Aestuariibacter sp. A3R04 TaxID=2841571 RepID=UPI001C09C601|nr:uracil-DNA glycosylase family protein [Aestuariibacter sp. A3R04]MBU3022005.1 uracil-DNA glycosylase family protein [Aestuariibacter sp. A3R04]